MGKKQKKNRRGKILKYKPVYPPQVVERIGLVSIDRKEAFIRLIDTAIWLWFLGQEPLTVHLIIMTNYSALHELGVTPLPPDEIDLAKGYTVYDFMRHSATKRLNEGVDFIPDSNEGVLYAVVKAFKGACGGLTTRMRVFETFTPVSFLSYREFRNIPEARDFLAKFLPKEITNGGGYRSGQG